MKKILFLILFFLVNKVYADTFLLKNGTQINGTLIEQSNRFIVYLDASGNSKNLAKADIQSIQINDQGRTPGKLPDKVGDLLPESEKASPGTYRHITPQHIPDTHSSNGVDVELTHEVVSDFIWRGNSYGGEYLARRNNTKYKEVSEYYAYQPNLRVNAPSGFYFELWGNLALTNRKDKDSDMRMLQPAPGGLGVDPNYYFDRLSNGNFYNPDDSSSVFFDPNQNLYSGTCDPTSTPAEFCNANPLKLKPRKEQNGMWRTDGLFTTFAYNFNAGRMGDFTAGVWWYFEGDKKGRYSWDEYFIWWSLPFLKKALAPQIQFFTQGSQDLSGAADGGNYLAFYTTHIFFEDKFFRIQPYNNIGYKNINNNTDQKSGFFDITTGIKFFFGDLFVSVNNAYRPDIHMYDNSTFYYPDNTLNNSYYGSKLDPAGTLNNQSQYDGKTVNPSRMFGPKNDLFYGFVNGSETDQLFKNYLSEKYYLQDIPRNLFWVSIGYLHKL
jgi:hypothetical protein